MPTTEAPPKSAKANGRAAEPPEPDAGAAPDPTPEPAGRNRTAEREYVVLTLTGEGEANIARVGTYKGGTGDDACWAAIDADSGLKAAAEAAGRGDEGAKAPKLVPVLAARFEFEEYVLEPIQETRRVKRS